MNNKYIDIYNDIFTPSDTQDLTIEETFLMKSIDIDDVKKNLINLLDAEYVIFPTNHFFHRLNPSIAFFEKTKITCLNYYIRYEILSKINMINKIIKSEDKKYDKIKDKIKKELGIEKLKLLYFLENIIEPNTLYKKIKFSTEEVFLSFETYSVKRIEYKLKTVCQLMEKMGAISVNIDYLKNTKNNSSYSGALTLKQVNINLSGQQKNESKTKFNMICTYDIENQFNNINLNIYELNKMIEKEDIFFISKDQFSADIDLKFIINSRCVNLVKDYETVLVFEYANVFERQVISKARNFGFQLNYSFELNQTESLEIKVKFINPYEKINCITGSNISPFVEGFLQLANLIKQEAPRTSYKQEIQINDEKNGLTINYNKQEITDITDISNNISNNANTYLKINNFIESHMKLYNEKKKLLEITFNHNIDLIKTYNHIINLNFSNKEISLLYYRFFKDNLTIKNLESFRKILLKPTENFYDYLIKNNYFNIKSLNEKGFNFFTHMINNTSNYSIKMKEIDKLIFTSHQYHLILENRLKVMNMLDKGLEKIKNKLLKKIDNYKNLLTYQSTKLQKMFKLIDNIKKNPDSKYLFYSCKNKNIKKLKKEYDINYDEYKENSYFYVNNNTSNNNVDNENRKLIEELKRKYDDAYREYYYDNINNLKVNYDIDNIKNFINKEMKKNLYDIIKDLNSNKDFYTIIRDIITNNDNIFFNNDIEGTDMNDCIMKILFYLMDNNLNSIHIESDIKNNFDLLSCEIKSIFNKFFYNIEGFFDLKFNFIACNERYKLIINNLGYIKNNDKELYKSFLLSLNDTDLCNSDELQKEIYNTYILEGSISSKQIVDKYDNLSNIIKKIVDFPTKNLEKNSDNINNFSKFFDNELYVKFRLNYRIMKFKNNILNIYKSNKISDFDPKILIIIHLLFDKFMNIEKNISEKSFFDEMYGFINEIIKTYNTQYNVESKIYIKHEQIHSVFNKNKIISNYQKYKIFFTFDDIENYYNDINNRSTERIDCNINDINDYDDNDNIITSNNSSNNNLASLDTLNKPEPELEVKSEPELEVKLELEVKSESESESESELKLKQELKSELKRELKSELKRALKCKKKSKRKK